VMVVLAGVKEGRRAGGLAELNDGEEHHLRSAASALETWAGGDELQHSEMSGRVHFGKFHLAVPGFFTRAPLISQTRQVVGPAGGWGEGWAERQEQEYM